MERNKSDYFIRQRKQYRSQEIVHRKREEQVVQNVAKYLAIKESGRTPSLTSSEKKCSDCGAVFGFFSWPTKCPTCSKTLCTNCANHTINYFPSFISVKHDQQNPINNNTTSTHQEIKGVCKICELSYKSHLERLNFFASVTKSKVVVELYNILTEDYKSVDLLVKSFQYLVISVIDKKKFSYSIAF